MIVVTSNDGRAALSIGSVVRRLDSFFAMVAGMRVRAKHSQSSPAEYPPGSASDVSDDGASCVLLWQLMGSAFVFGWWCVQAQAAIAETETLSIAVIRKTNFADLDRIASNSNETGGISEVAAKSHSRNRQSTRTRLFICGWGKKWKAFILW
jgi:hypothetical protein